VTLEATDLRHDRDAPIAVVRVGSIDYLEAWDLQRALVVRRQASEGQDVLLLLEHPPVLTLGRRADRSNVLASDDELAARGIELLEVDRGGDVTYHGPGQLVGYPILRLASVRGVVDYVRALEQVLIETVATFGLHAGRLEGLTGVWIDGCKVAAIGVRVASGGVTSHGFALNVTTALRDFDAIVPCGIADRQVCSLESLGIDTSVATVADRVAEAFARVFGATLEALALPALRVEGLR
jgi:lipoyl(octanoyl) transferase